VYCSKIGFDILPGGKTVETVQEEPPRCHQATRLKPGVNEISAAGIACTRFAGLD